MNTKCTAFVKSMCKRKGKDKKTKTNDDFIIKHRQNNKDREDIIDLQLLDQRRLVFISLIGLYQSWKKCPSYLLYSSLFVIPLKRIWIYEPSNHIQELQQYLISIFADSPERKEFFDLLKWKDSQDLVLWTLDYHEISSDSKYQRDKTDKLIDPFWYFLSDTLSNLYDPFTHTTYHPLCLDSGFWKDSDFWRGKQKYISILAELYFFTQKYDTMKQIILQSNANALRPVVHYTYYDISIKATDALFDEFDNDEKKEDWWISDQYNPYDSE